MKDRLDFVLPDFTRVSWVSDDARETWAPRIQQINHAWAEIEWRAVLGGVRSCSLTSVSPEDLITQGAVWAGEGLNVLPLAMEGTNNYCYASSSQQVVYGQPYVFRIVVGAPQDVIAFKQAWDTGDQHVIGRLLGYPPCCQDFFQETWVAQHMVDTTWPMAANTAGASLNGHQEVESTGPPESNILWRWMGVRPVSHMPCRLDCAPSVEVGKKMLEVGRQAGYHQEMDWLREILTWPVEWSALHGIAEIKNPILKISTRTDSTASKYTLRRTSDTYPQEGMEGLRFPYYQAKPPRVTDSKGFQRGLDNLIHITTPQPAWYAADNGFQSTLAMEKAHEPILKAALDCLADKGGEVLDLGCGNGALLKTLHEANPDIIPYGIERDPDRLEHVQSLLPQFITNFLVADLFDADPMWPEDRRYTLALLMPGRLLEVNEERATHLKARLTRQCEQVVVYAYGDWLTKYGDLQGLAQQAGFTLINAEAGATASLATLP